MSIYPSTSPSTAAPRANPLDRVQKVVVVNSSPEVLTLAERVLAAGHYDVVFVESIAHAYSQIRRVQPNLVILCLRMGDRDAFQLLSMLKLDPETRRVPVLTYTEDDVTPANEDVDPEEEAPGSEFFARPSPPLMN